MTNAQPILQKMVPATPKRNAPTKEDHPVVTVPTDSEFAASVRSHFRLLATCPDLSCGSTTFS